MYHCWVKPTIGLDVDAPQRRPREVLSRLKKHKRYEILEKGSRQYLRMAASGYKFSP